MRWCRLYVETPADPKLRRIAHQAGSTVANVLAVWTSMLCHAAQNEGEAWGTLDGWDDLDCAINLGIDGSVVRAIRREMEHRVTLENRLLKWDSRQVRSDFSAARMREWRKKKTEQKQRLGDDVTSRERHGDATVTPCDVLEENRREEILEPNGSNKARAKRTPVAAITVPEWLPADAWLEWDAHRRGMNAKAWTPLAAAKCIQKLGTLRDDGHDPRAVIEHSIASGYRGLFAPPTQRAPQQREGKLDWLIRSMGGEQ